MEFEISFDREEDGRWIAEAVDLPGVLAYGATQEEASAKTQAMAAEVIAEKATKT
jgi:predicted RNase H-like HicB family nuclease